jgi:adenylate cyclase
MAYAVSAHATLGDEARARELMDRAMLLDPNNANMRYNFVCATIRFNDLDGALDMLVPLFGELISQSLLNWSKSDPAFDRIREHPRFVAMMQEAEARLAAMLLASTS